MKTRIYKTIILAGCLISQATFAASCQQGEKTHIWISPRVITAGEPVNVMAVSSSQALTEMVLTSPNGTKKVLPVTANMGIPWQLSVQIGKLDEGRYQVEVKNKDQSLACREIFNGDNSTEKSSAWNESYEAFYAAWIEQLFDSPVDASLNFPNLEPVLRDPARNFLYNYLGLHEDN